MTTTNEKRFSFVDKHELKAIAFYLHNRADGKRGYVSYTADKDYNCKSMTFEEMDSDPTHFETMMLEEALPPHLENEQIALYLEVCFDDDDKLQYQKSFIIPQGDNI